MREQHESVSKQSELMARKYEQLLQRVQEKEQNHEMKKSEADAQIELLNDQVKEIEKLLDEKRRDFEEQSKELDNSKLVIRELQVKLNACKMREDDHFKEMRVMHEAMAKRNAVNKSQEEMLVKFQE